MKVKVVKSFTDKYTRLSNKPGSEIEVTKERFSEINGSPQGVLVKEIKETKKSTKK